MQHAFLVKKNWIPLEKKFKSKTKIDLKNRKSYSAYFFN